MHESSISCLPRQTNLERWSVVLMVLFKNYFIFLYLFKNFVTIYIEYTYTSTNNIDYEALHFVSKLLCNCFKNTIVRVAECLLRDSEANY